MPSLTVFTTYSAADHRGRDLDLLPSATEGALTGDESAVRYAHEKDAVLLLGDGDVSYQSVLKQ